MRPLDQPNIYALFVVQAARLTRPGGELLFLAPRWLLLGGLGLSGSAPFSTTSFGSTSFTCFTPATKPSKRTRCCRKTLFLKLPARPRLPRKITPCWCRPLPAPTTLAQASRLACRLEEIVDLGSHEKVLFLPTTEAERALIAEFKTWRGIACTITAWRCLLAR
ncbi:MAG: hypothetical protein WKG07_41830 [Hymenobacter sp.]